MIIFIIVILEFEQIFKYLVYILDIKIIYYFFFILGHKFFNQENVLSS